MDDAAGTGAGPGKELGISPDWVSVIPSFLVERNRYRKKGKIVELKREQLNLFA